MALNKSNFIKIVITTFMLFMLSMINVVHADSNQISNNNNVLNSFFKDNNLTANNGSQYIVNQRGNEYIIEERITDGDPSISHLKHLYIYSPKRHQGYIIQNNQVEKQTAKNVDKTFDKQAVKNSNVVTSNNTQDFNTNSPKPTYITSTDQQLPQTGNNNSSILSMLGIIILSFVNLLIFKNKKISD